MRNNIAISLSVPVRQPAIAKEVAHLNEGHTLLLLSNLLFLVMLK